MSQIQTLEVRSTRREEMIDITSLVRSAIKRAGVPSGIVHITCPHTTAGLTLQENADPDVKTDLLMHLDRMIPQDGGFRHAEQNADAHIKSTLVGVHLALFVDESKLVLGRWQAVWFCEFDGPRSRQVMVKVIAG